LALASGDLRRSPIAQTIEAKARKNFAAALLLLCRAERAETVNDVLRSAQVREERQILMYVPDAPFPGGEVPLLLRVVKVFAADNNAPVVRITQASNAIEQRGLSRARRTKEYREAGKRSEVDIQDESTFGIWKTFADSDFEIGRDGRGLRLQGGWPGWTRLYRHGPTAHERRFTPYTTDNTRNEMINSSSAVWFALE